MGDKKSLPVSVVHGKSQTKMDDHWQYPHSMDWFRGKITGKPHDLHGKNHGFRLKFSFKPIH